MMEMTYAAYDAMIDNFEKMKTPAIWPTYEQIEMFEKDPDKWIEYSCYVLEKAERPNNSAEKYSKSNLQHFVNSHLSLYD